MAIEFELSPKMQKAQEMAHMFATTFVRPYALETDALKGPHPKFIEACKQFGLGTGQARSGPCRPVSGRPGGRPAPRVVRRLLHTESGCRRS